MKNVDKIKRWLLENANKCPHGPRQEQEKEKVRNGDSMFIRNLYLIDKDSMKAIALGLGLPPSRCSFCWKGKDMGGSLCVHYSFPLNYCSQEILNWLDLEDGQEIPEEWKKRDSKERSIEDKERATKERIEMGEAKAEE